MNNIRTGSKYFIVFIQMQYITPTHYTSPLLSKNESGGLHQGVTRVSSTLRIPSRLSKSNMKTFNLPINSHSPTSTSELNISSSQKKDFQCVGKYKFNLFKRIWMALS